MAPLSRSQRAQHDFYVESKASVGQAKNLVKKVLLQLKFSHKIIRHFDIEQDKFLVREKKIKIKTRIVLSVSSAHTAVQQKVVFFIVSLSQEKTYVATVTSCSEEVLSVQMNYRIFSEKASAEIFSYLSAQSFGIQNEIIFLEKFLIPFSQKRKRRITYAHHASTQKDQKQGVDFVVGFVPFEGAPCMEICFQLKSSKHYVQKHVDRYPKVSLFIFHPSNLQNPGKLEGLFMTFLKKHQDQKVVIWSRTGSKSVSS